VATIGYIQELFQIRSICGLVSAMNAIYGRLREQQSVLAALGGMVDVPAKRGPQAVLRRVTELLQSTSSGDVRCSCWHVMSLFWGTS
jgi:hypothetical protein